MKIIIALLLMMGSHFSYAQTELLPDLITSPIHLYDQAIDTTTMPGRKLLRFANATPNIGRGKLQIEGGESNPDGTQNVYQRITRSDGSSLLRLAGIFDYHPEHGHTHFNDYAIYRLRKVKFLRGVGRIIRQSEKLSYCIMDSSVWNPLLPGFRPVAQYRNCDKPGSRHQRGLDGCLWKKSSRSVDRYHRSSIRPLLAGVGGGSLESIKRKS
jgi:hypothetical protein